MNIDALIQALRWTPSEGATTEESPKQDSTTDQLRIESLVLENFKSFQSGPHVFPLSDITLTFGQNNSGKSNFARAIQLLAQSISSGTENEPPSLTFSGANGVSDDVKFEAGGFLNCLNRDYGAKQAAQYLKRSLASAPERKQEVDRWLENPSDGKWTWDNVSEGFHHTHRFSIGFDFVNTGSRPIRLASTLFHNPGHFVPGPEFGRLRLVLEFGLEGSNFSTRLNSPAMVKELSRLGAPNKSPLLAFSVFGLDENQDGSAMMERDKSEEGRLLFRFEHDSQEEPSGEFNKSSRVFRLTHIDHNPRLWRDLLNSIADPEVLLNTEDGIVGEWHENQSLFKWARSPLTERPKLNRNVIEAFGHSIITAKEEYTRLRLTDLIVYAHFLYGSDQGLDVCCLDGESWESDRDATERLLWKLYQYSSIDSIINGNIFTPVSNNDLLSIINLLSDDEKESLLWELGDTTEYNIGTKNLYAGKCLISARGESQTEPFPLSREELEQQSRILRKMCRRTSVTSDEKSLFKSNIERLAAPSKVSSGCFKSHFCRVLICQWVRAQEGCIRDQDDLDSDEYISSLQEAGLELGTFSQVLQNDFEIDELRTIGQMANHVPKPPWIPSISNAEAVDKLKECSQFVRAKISGCLNGTIESIRAQMYNCFELNLTGMFEPTNEEREVYVNSSAQSEGGRQAQTWGLWGKDFDPNHFLHNSTPVPINLCVQLLDLACNFCGRRNSSDATLRVIPAHRPYANRSYTQDERDSLLGESFRNDEALGQILTAMGMPHQEFCVEKDLDTGFSKIKFGDALMADSGTGITQLLPILSCLQNQYQTLVVQEPEAHLHPSMHSYVGFLLGSLAGSKQAEHLLVETHSEHLVRACAALVRAGLIRNDQLSIVWVDHSASSGSSITEVPVDASGRFKTKWPEGFFEERLEIAKWAKQQSEAN